MGRSTFIIVFVSLIGLIAAVVPEERHIDFALDSIETDSTELKKAEIYICKGHYFEWCKESSTCAHCNEYLEKINLWDYYQLLECEDCQKFFEENYSNFIGEEPQL